MKLHDPEWGYEHLGDNEFALLDQTVCDGRCRCMRHRGFPSPETPFHEGHAAVRWVGGFPGWDWRRKGPMPTALDVIVNGVSMRSSPKWWKVREACASTRSDEDGIRNDGWAVLLNRHMPDGGHGSCDLCDPLTENGKCETMVAGVVQLRQQRPIEIAYEELARTQPRW